MREVDLLLLLVPLEHREIDDPAELEAVLLNEVEVLADLGTRGAGEFYEIGRIAGNEEHRVACLEAELRAKLFGALRPDIVGDGPASTDHAVFLGKENIA